MKYVSVIEASPTQVSQILLWQDTITLGYCFAYLYCADVYINWFCEFTLVFLILGREIGNLIISYGSPQRKIKIANKLQY